MSIAFEVKHVMTKEIISVDINTTVSKAASIMIKNNIGAVVVTKNKKPVGIITEVDIIKRCCIGRVCSQDVKAKEIMSSPLVTIKANSAIGEAATLMSDKDMRRLLVTEKGKIIGIITEKDVLRATLGYFESVLLTI